MRCSRVECGIHLCLLAVSLLCSQSGTTAAQGPYKAVTPEDVVKLEFAYYYTPERKYRDVDFAWTFTESEFVLKAGKGPIPADLQNRLLPRGPDAGEIRGDWKIDPRDGTRLVLSNIRAGERSGNKDVAFRSRSIDPPRPWSGSGRLNMSSA